MWAASVVVASTLGPGWINFASMAPESSFLEIMHRKPSRMSAFARVPESKGHPFRLRQSGSQVNFVY
jgi:hypothetical protein